MPSLYSGTVREVSMRQVFGLLAVTIVAMGPVAPSDAEAQVNPRDVPIVTQPQQRFDGGQDVQPIFEGWTRNEDGS